MQPYRRYRRMRTVVGLILCLAFVVQCHQVSRSSVVSTVPVDVEIVPTAVLITESMSSLERLAHEDPLAFFEFCLEQYNRNIHDYHVTFTKQELVGNKLTAEQVTEVRFKESPFCVDMVWTENAGRAGRVLYVEGDRVDKKGNKLALIKPSGILGGIGIKVWRAIHGRDAKREARRTIDQFGFKNTLNLIVLYSHKANAEGKLSLEFVGNGMIDGRPTYVFERRLPYTGQEEPYPDRLLVVHMDKEWLLPVGCFSYADDDGAELLGRYLLTRAEFNVGYAAADFDAKSIKF
ncbi:MAG: DUF1571 domain-containing protein [Phycisphaerae bacterium]|nr:DUF1571 domain-containing protein [Phycisphaerae bacterium]